MKKMYAAYCEEKKTLNNRREQILKMEPTAELKKEYAQIPTKLISIENMMLNALNGKALVLENEVVVPGDGIEVYEIYR